MLVTASIPLVLGIVGLIGGGERFVDADQVTPELDSQLRFSAVWFTVVFGLTVWAVRNLDRAGPVLRIMFATMALGGVARIVSAVDVGVPDPPVLAAIAIEVGVLAFIPWHAAVVGRNRR